MGAPDEEEGLAASSLASEPNPKGWASRVAHGAARMVRLRPIRLQLMWQHAGLLWKTITGFALSLSAVAVPVIVVALLWQEFTQRSVAIESITVPKELADNGYAPDVAARRLRDAVNLFVKKARASMKGPEIALRGDLPDIVVPAVGISLDSFVTVVRRFWHSSLHQSISGEFTVADRMLWLRLRLDGQEIYSSAAGGALERPDELLATAVPELLKKVQPFIVAQSLYRKDPAKALNTARDIILRLPKTDENVINAYVLEAGVYPGPFNAQYMTRMARIALMPLKAMRCRPSEML
jgi:hypothetical protein